MSKHYFAIFSTPRKIPQGRIVVHNHVRPKGFPKVVCGQGGFRAWSDVPRPKDYGVKVCDCGWAPLLRRHYRVKGVAS